MGNNFMNDKGKTVNGITIAGSSYQRRVKRGKNPERRFVEMKIQFHLNPDFPGESGYAATTHAIVAVHDRVVNVCANEFLP